MDEQTAEPEEDYGECTNASYQRWLRAQRPSWVWFFRRSEIEQEALAQMGDDHTDAKADLTARYLVESIDDMLNGYMEEQVEKQNVIEDRTEDLASKVRDHLGQPSPMFAGITERRKANEAEHKERTTPKRSFLGKAPDAPKEAEPA